MSEVTNAVASGAHRTDKQASSNTDPHGEHHVPMSTYWIIFAALMVLLVITVVAAFIDLGEANMLVAMTIAAVKAALVILYFMHVKFASRLTKVFVGASFLWLAILFSLGFMDYISRGWLSNSRGWNDNPIKAAYDAGTKANPHGSHGKGHDQGHGDDQGKDHGESHGENKGEGDKAGHPDQSPGNRLEKAAPAKPGDENNALGRPGAG